MSCIDIPIENTWVYVLIIAIVISLITVGLLWCLIGRFKYFLRATGIIYYTLTILSYISIFLAIAVLWFIWTRWAYFSG